VKKEIKVVEKVIEKEAILEKKIDTTNPIK